MDVQMVIILYNAFIIKQKLNYTIMHSLRLITIYKSYFSKM